MIHKYQIISLRYLFSRHDLAFNPPPITVLELQIDYSSVIEHGTVLTAYNLLFYIKN